MNEIDFDLPTTSKPRWPKYLTAGILGVSVVGLLMVSGARLQTYLQDPVLPANQQCLTANTAARDAAKTFGDQLAASLDGKDAPAPDLSAVKNAVEDCKANVSIYKVATK